MKERLKYRYETSEESSELRAARKDPSLDDSIIIFDHPSLNHKRERYHRRSMEANTCHDPFEHRPNRLTDLSFKIIAEIVDKRQVLGAMNATRD